MPSVIAGSLLVVAVFLWTRSVAGSLAAWIAALFVALAPISIQVSQFARFYALQGLVFWLAATGAVLPLGQTPRPLAGHPARDRLCSGLSVRTSPSDPERDRPDRRPALVDACDRHARAALAARAAARLLGDDRGPAADRRGGARGGRSQRPVGTADRGVSFHALSMPCRFETRSGSTIWP